MINMFLYLINSCVYVFSLMFTFLTCCLFASPCVPQKLIKEKKGVGVYWGAFDPPTIAHEAIIVAAKDNLNLEKLIIVVNNHNYKKYTYTLKTRLDLLVNILKSNEITSYDLLWQDDTNKIDYFALRQITTAPIFAIAGYDAYSSWIKYSTETDRSLYDGIIVIPRGDDDPYLFDPNAFLLVIGEDYKHVSSSRVKAEASLKIADSTSRPLSELKASTR